MARWITVKPAGVPFDYRWPDANAITAFTKPGEFFVKDDVADFAVGKGHATEGRAKGSTTRSTKSGPKAKTTKRRKSTKVVTDAKAPDLRPDNGVVRAGIPAPDRADAGGAVDTASV